MFNTRSLETKVENTETDTRNITERIWKNQMSKCYAMLCYIPHRAFVEILVNTSFNLKGWATTDFIRNSIDI